jgi:hypothetical protein
MKVVFLEDLKKTYREWRNSRRIKGMKEKIICQKKGCKNEANWIVISPSLLEKEKPNPIDLYKSLLVFVTQTIWLNFLEMSFLIGQEKRRIGNIKEVSKNEDVGNK